MVRTLVSARPPAGAGGRRRSARARSLMMSPKSGQGPVRVLMAVPQYPYPVVGGMERQAHELSKALIGLGVDVQAISGRIDSSQPAVELVDGVKIHRTRWSNRRW